MASSGTTRVLIVDDDEGIREVLRTALEDEGYEIIEAPDGVVALDILRALPYPIVVLTNHNMPRLDGPGLFSFVMEEPTLQRHRYLYMTASNRVIAPTFDRQLAALDVPVLRKPFNLDSLFALIADKAQQLPSPPEETASPPDGIAHQLLDREEASGAPAGI